MSAALLAVSLALLTCQASAGSFTWRLIEPDNASAELPPARRFHAMGFIAKIQLVVIFGGEAANGTILGDTWVYSLFNNTWQQLPLNCSTTDCPSPRKHMVSGVIQPLNWFIISAGQDSNTDYNDVWVLNFPQPMEDDMSPASDMPQMPKWTMLNVTGTVPEVRYGGHGGAYPMTGLSFWLGFGFNKKEETGKRLGDTFRITFTNTSTLHNEYYQWEEVHGGVGLNQYHPFLPHARCLESAAMTDDEQLVFHGGCLRGGIGGGPCPAEDSWVLDGNDKKWTELPRCVTPRAYGAMASLPRRRGLAILYGGDDRFDNGIVSQVISGPRYPENEIVLVDAYNETWTRKKTIPFSKFDDDDNNTEVFDDLPVRRYGHAMASGTTVNFSVDSENQPRTDFIDQIVMFGGVGLYDEEVRNDLWVLTGDPESSDDLSRDCPSMWFSYLHLHGVLQAVAWGMLFPTGVLVARYYRCGQSQAWLVIHVIIQLTALVMSIAAFVIVFLASGPPNFPHAIIGIILQIFAVQQPINGFLRPHKKDENTITRQRYCWELWHRSSGYFTVIAGLVNVTLGVFLIIPPLAVWIVWLCAILVWIVVFSIYETVHLLKVCECTGQRAAKDTEMSTYPGY